MVQVPPPPTLLLEADGVKRRHLSPGKGLGTEGTVHCRAVLATVRHSAGLAFPGGRFFSGWRAGPPSAPFLWAPGSQTSFPSSRLVQKGRREPQVPWALQAGLLPSNSSLTENFPLGQLEGNVETWATLSFYR